MSKLHAKQVARLISAFVDLSGVAVSNANSANITSALTTTLATAGDGGVAVPLQPRTTSAVGVITSGNNVTDVFESVSRDVPTVQGNAVYARVTESGGVYTASFFYRAADGTETATTLDGNYTLAIGYTFDLHRLPVDSLIVWKDVSSGDGGGSSLRQYTEQVTVTASNTFAALSRSIADPANSKITVNGSTLYHTRHFTASGAQITISAGQSDNIGHSVDTTDEVFAEYAA